MAAPTTPDPIHAPTRRFTIGLVFGLCIVAALLWIATG
jgi:hypothetical protein